MPAVIILPNSIAVIERPEINGVKKSIIIRGENKNNPVLLFVHGGSGMATFPYIKEQFRVWKIIYRLLLGPAGARHNRTPVIYPIAV